MWNKQGAEEKKKWPCDGFVFEKNNKSKTIETNEKGRTRRMA